ncbi:uncharacterized protein NPIL_378471 [Nephila pilipes]|uniref:DUF5641 domain-containing protein n=1 Tax=Nephila pilipes TaxID=299642 RepID=A0A8X6PGD8_NEPPI|nr:uncharacterized protein NPIL_378471 [Nephila pilipes]
MPRIEVQPGMPPEDRFRDGAIFEVVGVDLADKELEIIYATDSGVNTSDNYALKRDVLQKLCVGDVVLVEDINKRCIHWPLAKIIEIFPGRDNVVRLAKVKTDNGIFLRLIQRLFPLEISQSEDDPLPGADLLHKQAFQKQSAYPAAGPQRTSQDAASTNVPRTGRVIKPPQILDL